MKCKHGNENCKCELVCERYDCNKKLYPDFPMIINASFWVKDGMIVCSRECYEAHYDSWGNRCDCEGDVVHG